MKISEHKLRTVIRRLIEAEVDAQQQQQVQNQQQPQETQLQKARVKLFFDELQKRPTLIQKLDNITGPIEQAQTIIKFAELVGVPSSKIPAIISTLRQASRKQNQQ